MKTSIPTVLLAAGTLTPGALSGDITHQYGYDFLPIRDAGNAPYITNTGSPLYGGVNYEYRISDTVTTATQWADFLTDFVTAFGFGTVAGVSYDTLDNSITVPGGDGIIASPGFEQHPIISPWRGAAIYCNWLHHGRTTDPGELLIGAYDATTFGQDDDGNPTDQVAKLPNAQFWIPTRDELMKAAYYDPNRHGQGAGGYWQYPDAGDEPLFGAFPEDGGETNAFNPPGSESTFLPVRSYPNVISAYGLRDMSGVVQELTSTPSSIAGRLYGTMSSSGLDGSLAEIFDLVDVQGTSTIGLDSGRSGIRVATSIPTPATVFVPLCAMILFPRKR